MKFSDQNHLLTQRRGEILAPVDSHTISVQEYTDGKYGGQWNVLEIAAENIFKPTINIVLKGSLLDLFRLRDYDTVIVLLTYQLESQIGKKHAIKNYTSY